MLFTKEYYHSIIIIIISIKPQTAFLFVYKLNKQYIVLTLRKLPICVLTPVLYLTHRPEIDIDLLISLSEQVIQCNPKC